MPRPRAPVPHNRDGIWYLVRRVPKEFRDFDDQLVRRLSTEIRVADDPRAVRAKPAVAQLDRELFSYWRGRRDGKNDEALRRFEEAKERARQLQVTYFTAGELAAGPLDEILKRVNLLIEKADLDNETDIAAVLGGQGRSKPMVSGLLKEFEEIEAVALARMNQKQRRKASGTRNRALTNFREAIGGDKALVDLDRQDGLKFRVALQARVAAGAIDFDTANREMGAVSRMMKTVSLHNQLELPRIFAELRIQGHRKKNTRRPFSTDWIVNRILAPGALDGLNEDARDVVLLFIDHGMRPSESCDLTRDQIHLGHAVPHVSIEPDGKVLKTDESERDIPLVGAGVEIMSRHPNGFPRYRAKDAISATVNKFFRENGLMETPEHTFYGLRHSFDDRLTAAEAPERVTTYLMGHEWHREKYGDGPSLEQKKKWLERISLTGPRHLKPLRVNDRRISAARWRPGAGAGTVALGPTSRSSRSSGRT